MICGDAMMLGFVFKLVANAVSHGAIPPQLFTTQTLISEDLRRRLQDT